MRHILTKREKLMMLVLCLIFLAGFYVLVVHKPIEDAYEQIEIERGETELEETMAQTRLLEYNRMKAELEEIFSKPENEISAMPPYDNIQTLLVRFNAIFAGTEPKLTYSQAHISGGVATRVVTFNFKAANYEHARAVLTELTGMGYRCLLDSLTISPADGSMESGEMTLSGTITFYEQVLNN